MASINDSRKAYLHTFEAFLAFFVTFLFVVFIVAKGVAPKTVQDNFGVLSAVEQRDDFRVCVYSMNETCAEAIIDDLIPMTYDYKVSIGAPEPFKGSKDIYTETLFVVGNSTADYKIVYLYYWLKSG